MILDEKPYTFDRVIRFALSAALLWGLVWLLDHLSDVLIPFAAALLLAYMINPLVERVQKWVSNRLAAVLSSLFLVAAALVALAWTLVPFILNEASRTAHLLIGLVNNSEIAAKAAARLPPNLWGAIKEHIASPEVQQLFRTDKFIELVEALARKLLPGVWGFITGTTSILAGVFGLAIVGLYVVFLLLDYQKVRQGWKNLIPPSYRESVVSFVAEFDAAMNQYFRAQAAVASIVGILFAAGFTFIGLPMGILLGLFIGLLNMVPYLQTLGMVPAFILALVHAIETGTGFLHIFGLVLLVFAVVQGIQDGFLVPKIMGKVTGLSPAMILLSLSVWGKLLGLFGLLIALPMTCLLLAYYQRFLASSAIGQASPAVASPPERPESSLSKGGKSPESS